jgi:hypothetical protein
LFFDRTVALAFIASGAAALVVGCGSISVVSDGGSNHGSGGSIDIITGSGGTTGGAGGSGTGTGGTNGQGGAIAGTGGARTGTGGTMTGAGGAEGVGGAGGGAPGTGGRVADAGVDLGTVDAGTVCTAVRGCCSTDDDCNANQECAGMACSAAGRASGVCKARPNPNGNRCWTDADCAGQNNNNNTCTGAVICPCGVVCLRADALGMCN